MKDYDFDEYYWTDSSIALYWTAHDEQWAIFVRNSVKEIKKLTKQTASSFTTALMPQNEINTIYITE